MNEGRRHVDDCEEIDIGLRRSQAEAQKAVAALHGVGADDDWADDGWVQYGAEETDRQGAAPVELAVAVPASREGDYTTTTGARR